MGHDAERKLLFQTPSIKYRGKPFWAWNGALRKEELLRQIDIFKKMGFGGFFMHSRTGLETEYLGESWFRAIADCVEYAEKVGMEPWLYDEDRWPSGSAGGLATKESQYRASFLKVERIENKTLQWDEIEKHSLIQCFACNITDNIFSSKRKLKKGDQLKEGETAFIFYIISAPCRDVYNGNTYLDTMNMNATKHFIQLTHEAYRKNLSKEHFDAIAGIFTDEPHRGPMFTSFNGGNESWIPYTPELFTRFFEKYKYDLRDYLPELFFMKQGDKLSKTTYQYVEICQELFLNNFSKPIKKWCHDNGMKLTGHLLHEDNLSAQTIMQGSLMRFYENMDIPGVDHLLRDNCSFWIVKQVVSVARQLGKEQVLSELYGATGWNTTLEEYKQIGDWQALFGINFRCPHLAWYTMRGEAKRDYPASISYHLAGWKQYHYLEDYFSRINVFLENGEEDTELLVICPIESVWARSYSGAYDCITPRDNIIKEIEDKYETLFRILVENQISFDYGEEALIEKLGTIENGVLKVGRCSYKKVVLCGMYTIRKSTIMLLSRFRKSGGTVVFIGEVPQYVDVELSEEACHMAENSMQIPFEKNEIVKAFKENKVLHVSGDGCEDILVCRKKDSLGASYMLLNQNRIQKWKKLRICFKELETLHKRMIMEEWNARTGEVLAIPFETTEEGNIYKYMDFEPGQEKLIRLRECDTIAAYEQEAIAEKKIDTPVEFAYSLSEKNVCVLDKASVTILNSDGTMDFIKEQEVLRADCEYRKLLGKPMRSGEMLQPWYRKKYFKAVEQPQKVILCYSFEVQQMPDMLELALENTENIQQIKLNGVCIHMAYNGIWIDECFKRITLPVEHLIKGKNVIEVEQLFTSEDGCEAAYLLGDFSVFLIDENVPVIEKLPKSIKLGDITKQGFPFYSGQIKYFMPQCCQGNIKVSIKSWKGWSVTVLDYENKEHFVGFAPYTAYCNGIKEISLFLTRKNTFGPLHETQPDPPLCEPQSFLTRGKEWTDCYTIQKQGLWDIHIEK